MVAKFYAEKDLLRTLGHKEAEYNLRFSGSRLFAVYGRTCHVYTERDIKKAVLEDYPEYTGWKLTITRMAYGSDHAIEFKEPDPENMVLVPDIGDIPWEDDL